MSHIKVTRKQSVVDEIARIEEAVARRAYELFEQRGSVPGDACADWFAAEREVLRRPSIEVREEHGEYLVSASLPGVDPADVCVEVTPEDLVIMSETERAASRQIGHVHESEFRAGRIFRVVHLPGTIDVTKVQAVVRNGMLTVTAPAASPLRREVRVA